MKFLISMIAAMSLVAPALADVIFTQPQSPTGGLISSSWISPDGSDADRYAWENFTLSAPASITEIQWQGAGTVTDFTIVINPTYMGPDPAGAFARYDIAGTAGQTPIGIINGVQRYTYHYVLPTPLALAAGTNYCINIEGWESSVFGNWAISQATGGNGSHVDFIVGLAMFLAGPGDMAFTLIGAGSPQISQQPTSGAACAGGNATFSVVSNSSGPLTYQWRRATVNLTDNGHIVGSQTPTLQILGVTAADVAAYSCLVSNASGTTTSTSANLALSGPPVITLQPVPRGNCLGGNIVMQANATAALPVTAQWRRDGVPIPGATQFPNYVFLSSASVSGSYDCVFTNSCGTVITNAATVSLYPPMTITQQPLPAQACVGGPASFSVAAASSTPATYAWQFNGLPMAYWINPTSSSATLSIASVTAADFGSYSCVVTGSCINVTSSPAVLSQGSAPTIVSSPASVTTCRSGSVAFTVSASGSGTLGYLWSKDGVPMNTIANPSAGTATLAIPAASSADAGSYVCAVSNSCGNTGSVAATLTICPADMTCDGGVDINDLLAFLTAFETGALAADLDNGTSSGTPDGGVDINDLLYFLTHFEGGC